MEVSFEHLSAGKSRELLKGRPFMIGRRDKSELVVGEENSITFL